MANNLNAEQKKFVEEKTCNVLVSASAGSGKTTTMIEKLKNLIINDLVPVENLLVVTFTESAANEMKQKLYLSLSKELSEKKLTENQLNYFYEQLFSVSSADIGTLHSVCKKIVSKYFYEVNVEPAFKILTNEEYLNLFNQAINNTLKKYIECADEEFYEIYESFNDKRNSIKLKNIITSIYNFLSEKSNPKEYVNFTLKTCLDENINTNKCCLYVLNYYLPIMKKFLSEIKGFQKIINDEKLLLYLKQTETIIFSITNSKNYCEFSNQINNIKFPTLYKPKDAEFLLIFEQIKFSVESFKNVVKDAKKNCLNLNQQEFSLITKNLSRYYKKLFEITTNLEKEFRILKNEQGKLDFSDLQKYALAILQNNNIKTELMQHYKYIFVDEYQDINQIQEDILINLSNNKNLNMIGDVKQSIYAFRQCMPEIFLNKYYKYLKSTCDKLILLNKNYRCSSKVVDFVNYCFNSLITTDTIGINYEKEAQLILGCENSGEVTLSLINTESAREEENEENSEEIKSDEAEALKVAQIITEVYGKEYYDSAQNKTLKLDYKDIAILVRDAKGFSNTLYKVLKAHQIPVSTTLKTPLFKTPEIKFLHSLIKLINKSDSDLDICNVLVSPIINISYSELLELKQTYSNDNFYNGINKYMLSVKNTDLYDKLLKYKHLISNLRYRLNYSTIMEVINRVVLDYDLINYYSSLPSGFEIAENIRQFIALLNNSGFNYNINKCLEFLESLEKKDDFLVSIESGENAVKILTMHKSKGLEYPCVIVSNLGKNFNKSTYRSDVVLTNTLGVGINYRNTENRKEIVTLQKNANMLFELNQQLQEQIRLLYVSFTRARNFLYLTGCYNFKNFATRYNKSIFSATNFLDLIFKSVKGNNKFGFINIKQNFDIVSNKTKIAKVEIINLNNIKTMSENVKRELLISGENEEVVKKLINNFNKSKPKLKEKLATKNSVTGLMREDDYVNENELSLVLDFGYESKDNISLKIGNAYHKIMQNLTYKESKEEIEKLVSNMFLVGKLDLEIKQFVDVNKIFKAKQNVCKLINEETKILKEQQFLLKTPFNEIIKTSNNNQKVLIQGVVDLVLINKDNAILIDFKTNKTKDVAKLINSYGLQLEVYKKAVSEGLKVKIESSKLYLFETETFVEIV